MINIAIIFDERGLPITEANPFPVSVTGSNVADGSSVNGPSYVVDENDYAALRVVDAAPFAFDATADAIKTTGPTPVVITYHNTITAGATVELRDLTHDEIVTAGRCILSGYVYQQGGTQVVFRVTYRNAAGSSDLVTQDIATAMGAFNVRIGPPFSTAAIVRVKLQNSSASDRVCGVMAQLTAP